MQMQGVCLLGENMVCNELCTPFVFPQDVQVWVVIVAYGLIGLFAAWWFLIRNFGKGET